MTKIAIIGAGASGIFTAINAKNEDNQVFLFDKNEKIGKKLFITGKGRCNITNSKIYDEFLDNIVVNEKFLFSSFNQFDNFSMMDYLEKDGLKLVVERGDRVFPKSEKSSDVIKFFKRKIREDDINLRLNENIKSIKKVNDKFYLKSEKDSYEFDNVVIATGGLSYPKTGSTGDGYVFAKNFGLKVEKTFASLVPIKVKDDDVLSLEGISLKNINLRIECEDKTFEKFGEMLFAKKAITGPVVLSLSSYINKRKVKAIYLDLKPALSFSKLEKRLIRDFDENPNLDISNNLKKLLLNAFIDVILNRSGINPHKKTNQLTKEERQSLMNNIKNFSLEFDSLDDISRAVVTSGGVNVREINPKNMESKKIPGLYFVGEVLDVDGLTGGFNLQIAFTTAFACAKDLKEIG